MSGNGSHSADVIVIGGGMAGMAASFHLAKAGLQVTCLDPQPANRQPVGESLDWATPDLLTGLGFPRDYLLGSGISTWKRHVTLRMRDGTSRKYAVTQRMTEQPYNAEPNTLHADRTTLDRQIRDRVAGLGVTLLTDRATGIQRRNRTIEAIRSAAGRSYTARWFVDCSGHATSLFAREFRLPSKEYGPPKVALWTYFDVGQPSEGTTIYTEAPRGAYLEWIWEIPITAQTISVGLVATGETVKGAREQGLSVEQILRRELLKFRRFESLLDAWPGPVHVTSYRCRGYKGVAGPNWFIAGEAASMVDPITSNGVSAALRHAAEGSALIISARNRTRLSRRARFLYSLRALHVGRFFNSGIEKMVYQPAVRDRIGLPRAAYIYTAAAWSLNTLYSRLRPRGTAATLALHALLNGLRLGAWGTRAACVLAAPKG